MLTGGHDKAGTHRHVLLQVQQSLTVSHNKLGDLWYRVGNLESARAFYRQALNRRHALWVDQPDNVVAQIDYALSLAKVADIEQVIGRISLYPLFCIAAYLPLKSCVPTSLDLGPI